MDNNNGPGNGLPWEVKLEIDNKAFAKAVMDNIDTKRPTPDPEPEPKSRLQRDFEREQRAHRYWHRAFTISMFFHGFISLPILIAIVRILIENALS